MTQLTDAGMEAVRDLARQNQVSEAAVMALFHAVQQGHGKAAQFNHAELGGMGQWSSGGMTQIGDMFNDGLKAKVSAMAARLADLLDERGMFAEANAPRDHNPTGTAKPANGGNWWPDELGTPGATGGQNDAAYALFPSRHRLAVRQGGQVRVYDRGDHEIGGFSQQQGGGGGGTLRFSSQHGQITLADLREV